MPAAALVVAAATLRFLPSPGGILTLVVATEEEDEVIPLGVAEDS
jgi:hypothetical protein